MNQPSNDYTRGWIHGVLLGAIGSTAVWGVFIGWLLAQHST